MRAVSSIFRNPLRVLVALALVAGSPAAVIDTLPIPASIPFEFSPAEEEEQDGNEAELKEIEAAPAESRSPGDRPCRTGTVGPVSGVKLRHASRHVQASSALANGLSTHYRV
jgi:hypothetical protein